MKKIKNEIWEWIKTIGTPIILFLIINTFFFTPVVVDGASMMPTLEDHDRIILSKIEEPKRFDIVVFHATEEKDYIKRVIGLPGDQIEYKNDTLYINGQVFEENYLDGTKTEQSLNRYGGLLTTDFSVTVPEGCLFVMGDNRRNSQDSRHIGAIPMGKVVGVSKIIFWPIKDIEIVNR
ncbi:MAG TPA: signal peptidase I [Bacillus bacterium]|nr:signal peptidase I [Bacillus sp. (in: firmicutes)]